MHLIRILFRIPPSHCLACARKLSSWVCLSDRHIVYSEILTNLDVSPNACPHREIGARHAAHFNAKLAFNAYIICPNQKESMVKPILIKTGNPTTTGSSVIKEGKLLTKPCLLKNPLPGDNLSISTMWKCSHVNMIPSSWKGFQSVTDEDTVKEGNCQPKKNARRRALRQSIKPTSTLPLKRILTRKRKRRGRIRNLQPHFYWKHIYRGQDRTQALIFIFTIGFCIWSAPITLPWSRFCR